MKGLVRDRVRHQHRYRIVITHHQCRLFGDGARKWRLRNQYIEFFGIHAWIKMIAVAHGVEPTPVHHHRPGQARDSVFGIGHRIKVAERQRLREKIPPDKITKMRRIELGQFLAASKKMGKNHAERATQTIKINASPAQEVGIKTLLQRNDDA